MDKGWISIHRKIRECEIWDTTEPFTRRDAWIDLLLLANHRDKEILFDGKRITVKKGQYLTSVRKLAQEWNWGKDKTLKYLHLLEELGMITRSADTRRTLITIVNYSVYQDGGSQSTDTDTDSEQTVNRHQSATNNNVNNINKLKKEYPTDIPKKKSTRFIKPSLEEVKAYCHDRNNGVDPEKFINFYESKGWMVGKNPMKDWKAAVRTWEKGNNRNGDNNKGSEEDSAKLDELVDRLISGEEEGELLFV